MLLMDVDVVPADVPFLVGLDTMDKYGFYVNTVVNKLVCTKFKWKMDIVRKLGHTYLEWQRNDKIMFTRTELTKLHRNF